MSIIWQPWGKICVFMVLCAFIKLLIVFYPAQQLFKNVLLNKVNVYTVQLIDKH